VRPEIETAPASFVSQTRFDASTCTFAPILVDADTVFEAYEKLVPGPLTDAEVAAPLRMAFEPLTDALPPTDDGMEQRPPSHWTVANAEPLMTKTASARRVFFMDVSL
jgi:hypothetical protein